MTSTTVRPVQEQVVQLAQVKADYSAIFELPEEVEPGLDAVRLAQGRIDAFAARWRDSYPAAVRSLLKDREADRLPAVSA